MADTKIYGSKLDTKKTQPAQGSEILKKQNTIVSGIFVFVALACIFLGFRMVTGYVAMNLKSDDLINLINFDTTKLQQTDALRQESMGWNTFNDMIGSITKKKEEKETYEKFFSQLMSPYENFLQYLLLPRLNIWKHPFTEIIDTSLVGKKFLDTNPYTDIALILKRGDFFRDVGDKAQFNDIKNIIIKPLEEDVSGYFRIPIDLEFRSPTRRSFLLLVEKISSTANKENIMLINEFTYNLWQIMLTDSADQISQISGPGAMSGTNVSNDKKLGYRWYATVFGSGSDETILTYELLSPDMIKKAIARTAGCKQPGSETCGYLFREKFRTLPFLAYTITDNGSDTVLALKEFYRALPSLIQISQFSFDKSRSQNSSTEIGYDGTIGLFLYGKGISTEEVTEIQQRLGTLCFRNPQPMTLDTAKNFIQQGLGGLGTPTTVDATKSRQMREVLVILNDITPARETATNYAKIVTSFEIWRTLADAGICDA
ncbi:MAG: hypothetical protein NZL83_04395 [Candidatus Absconditabacterales bacterium]|nr:hypothetical protein [Candidatus Absconditabacterales bacterium]